MDVALASCRALPEPDPDAAPLARALAQAGIEAGVLAWDDPAERWSKARMIVLRSTWNYPEDRDGFLTWAAGVADKSALWNPLSVLRWNTHKRYLLDLGQRGVPVTPTAFVPAGSDLALREIMAQHGWREVVVKPAVSAASFRTMRVGPDALQAGETHLRMLARECDVLVQEFLPSVEGYGERALVWIDGALTHAVRKTPRFEGQDEAVSSAAVEISADEASMASQVLAAVEAPLLYARIDVAPGADGRPVLMELELVEPSLFFSQCPEALTRFVAGIRRRLNDLT